MAGTAVRFLTPYKNYAPTTIFDVDQATKTLKPYGSGSAYTEAGFQFGQERPVTDPNEFAGFSVGPIINDRAAALAGVKNELNQFQNNTFAEISQPAKRASSTLEDNIAKESEALSTAMAEFKTLTDKYKGLTTPNYEDAYKAARVEAGVPGLEKDFVDVRQNRRELPHTERANTGNAAVATESQLGAQTAQKDIPLEAREANLIDRLSLASDFINQSLKFKELDANTARTAIENAINLVGETINMSRTSLGDLKADKKDQQDRKDMALEFAINNNINTPAFVVGTQGYDARTLEPISLEQYQALTNQQVGLPENQTNFGPTLMTRIEGGKQEEKALVMDLISKYPDAGIAPGDSFVVASSKLRNSRIYQEQIRPPSSGGGITSQRTAAQDSIVANAKTTFQQQASSSKDGKVNPDSYRSFKQDYISKGGSATDFFQMFPVEQFISPGNQKGDLVQSTNAQNTNQEARLQQLLQKSNNGQNIDALSPEEQIELYSLL